MMKINHLEEEISGQRKLNTISKRLRKKEDKAEHFSENWIMKIMIRMKLTTHTEIELPKKKYLLNL